MRRRSLPFFTWLVSVAALLWPLAGLTAPGTLTQAPILSAASSLPNLMFIFDDSGSMGWTGRPWMGDIGKAKTAIIALLDELEDVNVGVMSFNAYRARQDGYYAGNSYTGSELNHEMVNLKDNRESIYDAIGVLTPEGGTPLVDTLEDLGRYFIGQAGQENPGSHPSSHCTANGQYTGNIVLQPERGEWSASVDSVWPNGPLGAEQSESPICHWCQQNFAIYMTDGRGGGGLGTSALGKLDGPGWRHPGGGWGNYQYCPECYNNGVTVAKALHEMDLRPDIKNFKGEPVKNNVTLYTIGFNTSQTLLRDIAQAGGGIYLEAHNTATLLAAYQEITRDMVTKISGSSSGASFNTSSLKSDSMVYLTRFDSENWTGDLTAAPFSLSAGAGTRAWSAAEQLDSGTKSPAMRTMITYNTPPKVDLSLCPGASRKTSGDTALPSGGVPFRWNNMDKAHRQDLIFDATTESRGRFQYALSWGDGGYQAGAPWKPANGPGQFGLAFDVAVGMGLQDYYVYVADYHNHRIQVFNPDGNFERFIGLFGYGEDNLVYPSGIGTDQDGNLYVAQHATHTVKKFNYNGVRVATYGGYGSGDATAPEQMDGARHPPQLTTSAGENHLDYPFDVAVDAQNNIYVVELQNHRIKVLNENGNFVRTFGSYGSGDGEFKYPNRIAIDHENNVYVSDYLNHRIQKFDSEGTFLAKWGGFGTADGSFQYPYGIDVDSNGNVFVLEYEKRVQEFRSDGVHIASYGDTFGSGDDELGFPRGIAVYDQAGACEDVSFFVADGYNNRVVKYSADNTLNADEAPGIARLGYLRGERSNEDQSGYQFRKRDSLLGDIVHSSAVHVGQLNLKWPTGGEFPTGANAYSQFVQSNRLRRRVMYVGANDGMLHAFDARTGEELLAYLPGNLFTNARHEGYHYLTDPYYNHRFYVDATPTVSEAYIRSHFSTAESWRTVLVSGEGAGGRGVFALDITDPGRFHERNAGKIVLWEFTDEDDPHLGFTFAKPTVALLPNGRWAAIFGNGYNSTDTTSATAGQAELFIVFLDGGLDGRWTEGTDYVRISTGIGSPTNRNGLSTPAVIDTDGDRMSDRVYAGDILGNMWAFDLSNELHTRWSVAGASFGGATPEPLFSGDSTRPITVKPEVIGHPGAPKSGNAPNTLVFFGTGQYLVANDYSTTLPQRIYAVWDRGDLDVTSSDLVQQTLLDNDQANGRVTDSDRWTTLGVNYNGVTGGDRYGWYLDLPDLGERVVTDANIRGKVLYFNTLVPTNPMPCTSGGAGWMMSVDAVTGGSPKTPAFDFDGDGVLDDSDSPTLTSAGSTGVANPADATDYQSAGYAGIKYQNSGGVPAGSMLIGNRRVTAGTGIDDAANLGGGAGDNSVNVLEPLAGGPTGRLSWDELLFNK